jgi:hypothetical protein
VALANGPIPKRKLLPAAVDDWQPGSNNWLPAPELHDCAKAGDTPQIFVVTANAATNASPRSFPSRSPCTNRVHFSSTGCPGPPLNVAILPGRGFDLLLADPVGNATSRWILDIDCSLWFLVDSLHAKQQRTQRALNHFISVEYWW